MDLVDVIIPTYNRAKLLPRAIQSVLNQNYQYFKLWIVDDGSTDETSQVLEKYASHPKVTILSTKSNNGVSAARNLAIKRSQAPYIAFLDSDDEWLEHKLSMQLDFLHKNPHIPLVHGEEIWVRRGVRVNPKLKHQKSGGDQFARSLKLCVISPSTCLLKRSLMETYLFREDFPVCEDYDLWLRICSKYRIGFIEEAIIIKYGGHEDQLSQKYKAMDFYRLKSIFDLYGYLDQEQRKLAFNEFILKYKVLEKGYQKYGRYEELKQIQLMYEKLTFDLCN